MPYPCCCQPVPGPCSPFASNIPEYEKISGDWTFDGPEALTADSAALAIMDGKIHPSYDWTMQGRLMRSDSALVFDYADQYNYHQAKVTFTAGVGGELFLQKVTGGAPSTIVSRTFPASEITPAVASYDAGVDLGICRHRENVNIQLNRYPNLLTRTQLAYGPLAWDNGQKFGLATGSSGGRFLAYSPYRNGFEGDPYNCPGSCDITCVGMYYGREPATYLVNIPNTFTDGPLCSAVDFTGDFTLDKKTPLAESLLCWWQYAHAAICYAEPTCDCWTYHRYVITARPVYDRSTRKAYFEVGAATDDVVNPDCSGDYLTECDHIEAVWQSGLFDIRDVAGFGSMSLSKVSESYRVGTMLGGSFPATITLAEP